MELTPAEVDILLQALNDREGVLSTDWEAAARANNTSLLMSLCEQLRAVRLLADKLAPSNTLQSRSLRSNDIMRAKWPGRCTRTGTQIRVGDEIVSDGRGGWELPATDPRLQPVPAPAPIHRVGISSASHWRRAQARRSSTLD